MTVFTSLDQPAFFHALWVQNELYSKRMVMLLRIFLVLIVLAITFSINWVNQTVGWGLRAAICLVVLGVHAVVSKRARRKMLGDTAASMIESNGGELHMEYRFGEDSFTAVGPNGEEEIPYSRIAALCETEGVFLLVIGRSLVHAVRKADLSGDDRRAFASLLMEKTGEPWRAYQI